jgi:hypothetical protein
VAAPSLRTSIPCSLTLPPRSSISIYLHFFSALRSIFLFFFLKQTYTRTQVLAACMIPDAVVHVTVLPDYAKAYTSRGDCRATVVEHGYLPRALVPLYLSGMDLNLYASLSECFP